MRTPIKIGSKEYKYKKDVINHYRSILNLYKFDQSLNESDFNDIIDLLDFHYFNQIKDKSNESILVDSDQLGIDRDDVEKEEELVIEDIKVARVQFNTKCFELCYSDGTSGLISYLRIINNKRFSPEDLFYIACRNTIHNDVRGVKQEYFDKNSKKGKVKCQETSVLSSWEELVVDHRQPNTFSIIVDRFKEVNKIDLDEIEYETNDQNQLIFKSEQLSLRFREYHKEKASLRIVRKECNSSRTGMGRIKKTAKDLKIK